jgi:hypothetical protein
MSLNPSSNATTPPPPGLHSSDSATGRPIDACSRRVAPMLYQFSIWSASEINALYFRTIRGGRPAAAAADGQSPFRSVSRVTSTTSTRTLSTAAAAPSRSNVTPGFFNGCPGGIGKERSVTYNSPTGRILARDYRLEEGGGNRRRRARPGLTANCPGSPNGVSNMIPPITGGGPRQNVGECVSSTSRCDEREGNASERHASLPRLNPLHARRRVTHSCASNPPASRVTIRAIGAKGPV